MHDVLIPLIPGTQPLDVVGPHEVFALASVLLDRGGRGSGDSGGRDSGGRDRGGRDSGGRDRGGRDSGGRDSGGRDSGGRDSGGRDSGGRDSGGGAGYTIRLAAATAGPVHTDSGLGLVATETLPERGPIGTLLVPGGLGMRRAARYHPEFVDWVRRAAPRAQRVASVCTGTFPLAAAGLLDGLAATTHWRWTWALAREHPAVDVHADAIYLRQGRVWTSGGVTAGIDLALALVEADHGPGLAQQIAREMLVFVRRSGGQSQFAAPAWAPPAGRPAVRAAQDLIHADPAADLRIPAIAARVGMSVRHLTREFARELGASPAEYVEQVRVDAARRLLESEPVLVTVAATRCGFGSAETMRKAFLRRLGVPPDRYRRHFATDNA